MFYLRGGLVEEFRQIFSHDFLRNSDYYVLILQVLSTGAKEISAIQTALKLNSAGRIAEYLWELELAEFIARDYTWRVQTGEDGKLSMYRLKDNYVRFYLEYIQKALTKIQRGNYAFKALNSLAEWHGVMGLQFENIVLNNRAAVHRVLRIAEHDIVSENPYFQRATRAHKWCQIDYLIQTRFGTLYVCEIKYSKAKIGMEVIAEIEHKITAMVVPKGISFRPVLIHVNGVTEDLLEDDYFADIIAVEQLL